MTVAVDLTAFGGGVKVRCAPGTPATGVAALQQAGFTVAGTAQYGLAFICRINDKPTPAAQPCTVDTADDRVLGVLPRATPARPRGRTAPSGASTYKPLQGSIEGWAFGATAKPSKTPTQIRNGK